MVFIAFVRVVMQIARRTWPKYPAYREQRKLLHIGVASIFLERFAILRLRRVYVAWIDPVIA
jgi:hypothetical protein